MLPRLAYWVENADRMTKTKGWRPWLTASPIIVACFGCGLAFAQPQPALDASAGNAQQEGAVQLSTLDFGQLLLQEGRIDDAEAFIRKAAPTSPADRARQLYLLALIAKTRGAYDEALEFLEDALSIDPDFTPARLQLADLYLRDGDRRKADYHLTVILRDTRLDTETTGNIDTILDRIRDEDRLSFTISAAILPQTNVTKRARLDTVTIADTNLELSEDAQAQSGFGGFLVGSATYQPVIADQWRGRLSASGSARIYENDALNEIQIGGEAGVMRLLSDGSLRAGVRASRLFFGGEGFRWTVGPTLGWQKDLSPRSRASMNLEVERRVHDESSFRDGYRFSMRGVATHAPDIKTLLELNASAEFVTAKALDESGPRASIGGAVTRGFDGGLVLTLGLNAAMDRRAGNDAFFAERRRDVLVSASASVLHRRVRYAGFAPFLEYGFERNISTIPFYDFSNHRLGLGVTRRF